MLLKNALNKLFESLGRRVVTARRRAFARFIALICSKELMKVKCFVGEKSAGLPKKLACFKS